MKKDYSEKISTAKLGGGGPQEKKRETLLPGGRFGWGRLLTWKEHVTPIHQK